MAGHGHAESKTAMRIYGTNTVYWQGRFISGPDSRACFASLLMILVPSICWQVEVGVFFAVRYSAVVPIIAILLQLGSLGALLCTAFSDPGIIPRQKDYTEQWDEKSSAYRSKQPARYFDLVVRGHPFKLKYCTTCNIYRPPRCTHCSVCENCIERFDHHCPWIGNCIGKRNYFLFYCFITLTALVNAFVLATSMACLAVLTIEFQRQGVAGGEAFAAALRQAWLAAALVIYALLIIWFTVGLCVYHNYLICTNQTTYEQIKGLYSNSAVNPFYRGILGNFQDVLFSRVRPRYFNASSGEIFWPTANAANAKQKGLETPLTPRSVSPPPAPGAAGKTDSIATAPEPGSPDPHRGPRVTAQASPSPVRPGTPLGAGFAEDLDIRTPKSMASHSAVALELGPEPAME